jgi:hypothetical protein
MFDLINARLPRQDAAGGRMMEAFKPRIRFAALAVLFLSGCASTSSYWERDHAWAEYSPTQIAIVAKDDPSPLCGAPLESVLGCAVRQRNEDRCTVFVNSRLPNDAYRCVVTHEMRHCFGERHDAANAKKHFAVDCGNGELYMAPARANG